MFNNFEYRNIAFDNPHFSKMAHWLIITTCIILFFYATNTPEQNWDILGYAGSSVSIENSNDSHIHNYIYQELKEYSTDEEFKDLTDKYNYRRVMFEDVDAFNQQIPFYKIRIIFVLLIFALMKIGINIFAASHLLSAALVSGGYLAFYYAYKKSIHPMLWVSYPLFIIIFDVVNVAQTVTADSLAFFWMGLISFTLMNAHWKSLFFLLVSLTLVRTDMIILVALISGYLILSRTDLRFISIAIVLISLVLYFFVNHFVGNYGWSTVFHYVFITGMEATHPDEYSSFGISFKQYITAVITHIPLFISERTVLLFEILVFLQFLIWGLYHRKYFFSARKLLFELINSPVIVLTLISVIYVILHYAVFPILDSRFFVGQYIISTLGLLSIISSILKKFDSDSMTID
jgi:hypothetical protein